MPVPRSKPHHPRSGVGASGALSSLLDFTSRTFDPSQLPHPFAAAGRVRGTGPGVSFSGLVAELEAAHPLDLVFPFEGSDRVGGAAWVASELMTQDDPRGIAKLRWDPGADDLPMHAHMTSDRFIVVLEGRGFFHASGQPLDAFDGTDVRTIAARRHDVFAFTRGVVHTFSTGQTEGMTLLSVHLPYIALGDPEQYALPEVRWIARERLEASSSRITAVGWERLIAG